MVAGLFTVLALCVAAAWLAAIASDDGGVSFRLSNEYPATRWVVVVDRQSLGVFRVRDVDLDALGEPAATEWLRHARHPASFEVGLGYAAGDMWYFNGPVPARPYHGPMYAGYAAAHFARIGVPVPVILPLLAAVPALIWGRRLRSRRRIRRGHCPGCGYDLRASAGRCPECGRSILRSTSVG